MDLSAEHAYLFRHAVVRAAAYELQMPTERTQLHGLALEILESVYDTVPDALALELAYHARMAGTERAQELEKKYLDIGGDYARFNYDYPNALAAFERLYELAGNDAGARASVADKLADLMERLGRWSDALEYFKEVHEHHPNLENVGRALVHLAWVGGGDDAERYADEGERVAEKADSDQLREAFLQLRAKLLFERGEVDQALSKLEEAIAFAVRIGDRTQELVARMNASEYEALRGNIQIAKEHNDVAYELSATPRLQHMRAGVILNRISLAIRGRDFEAALSLTDQAIKISETTGSRGTLGWSLLRRGSAQCGLGRYTDALKTFDEAREIAAETRDVHFGIAMLETRAVLLRLWGKHELLMTEFTAAIKELAGSAPSEQLDGIRAELALCRAEGGFGIDALDQLNELCETLLPSDSLQLNRAALHSSVGQHDVALEVVNAWLAESPAPDTTAEPVEFMANFVKAQALAGLGRKNRAAAEAALTIATRQKLEQHPSPALLRAIDDCRNWVENVDSAE